MSTARFHYVLRLADNPLILGQRLSEWCGHGPVLEEDLAVTNIALDLIGQARLLLSYVGVVEGRGRGEDELAFLRAESEYRNFTLVELPNGDFAATIVRNLLFGVYQQHLWEALQRCDDPQLAAISGKSAKETRYHVRHATDWAIRLGDGTEESHSRMQRALDALWPYTAEFFAADAVEQDASAAGYGVTGASFEAAWESALRPILDEATLRVPERTPFRSRGKHGVHSEHMGHLLAEMQYMQRAYPGLQW